MAHALLVTQCLQEDFVGSLGPHDPLPNALHVGAVEAARLLGSDPHTGPVAQLMAWARSQPPEQLSIVHVRDWHDATDPRQADHLARFGPHCLAGQPGARLVLGLDEGMRPGEHTVDALTLNDFTDTRLGALIDTLPRPLRVAVVGAWTEAKVTFLLYELHTRCGIAELATCSALTASASRARHFQALDQLGRLLGVRVFDSVGELSSWLSPDGSPIALPPVPRAAAPEVTGVDLSETDRELVGVLYRDASRVDLGPLGGGFSGASVYRARAWDALGHELAPTVLKLGERGLVAKERAAFEQVEGILGNDAPAVRGFADLGERAGLKYAFAAMGRGEVATFKRLYEQGLSDEELQAVVARVYDDVLGRFSAAATYERLPLLEYYTFSPRWADGVQARVEAVLGGPAGELLHFPGDRVVPNPAAFYRQDHAALDEAIGTWHPVSWVHGDLNGANILRDGQGNVWLIDFFHAHRGHGIRDLVKLESDLQFLFTPLADEGELQQAMALTDALRTVADLAGPMPALPAEVRAPALRRAWRAIALLRQRFARVVREDRDPVQISVALLRYAAHTLGFDEASPLQRRWALYAAGAHAADVLAAAATQSRLRVDALGHPLLGAGSIGLTICPGRRDRQRQLDRDLEVLAGHDALLCLLPQHELDWAGVPDLLERARGVGLDVWHHPIRDQGVPAVDSLRATLSWVQAHVDAGRSVVVHCMGGLGRSGLVAACALVERGLSGEAAIAAVRAARSPRAVETREQERFVQAWIRR